MDLFGPFTVKGEVNKRAWGKTYGILFTCLACRAVHVELTSNYSADGLFLALRRFASLHGCPSKLYSDSGTQLTAPDKKLRMEMKGLDWKTLKDFGAENGLE